MNKAIWWIIAIIVIIGGIYYFAAGRPAIEDAAETPAVNNEGQNSFTTPPAGEASSQKSLKDLIGLGVSQQCTFSQTVSNSQTNGTVYVGGGKMRGDFNSVSGNQTVKAHMISDGKDVYTWMDGIAMGFKMSADQSTPATGTGASQSNSPDLNQKLDYDCSAWTADASKFALPSGVQFTALGGAGLTQ